MTANELSKLPNDEQVVMVRAIDPFRLKKFKLEGHPNFKLSADGDGQRLIIHDWFNLEKKIGALEEKRGVETKREKQDDINQRAQQPVDGWLNKQFAGNGKRDTNRDEKEDDFFF
jgi:type IV secretory pathway TraG/TraD family ATPase VirD4